jgi:hypothetical protein
MNAPNANNCLVLALLLGGAACNKDKSFDTALGACVPLIEGHWIIKGTAIGMTMTGTLTLDDSGCAFAFSDWTMQMDMPDGGVVERNEIRLTGSGKRDWGQCMGNVNSEMDANGGCDDGAIFEMFLVENEE